MANYYTNFCVLVPFDEDAARPFVAELNAAAEEMFTNDWDREHANLLKWEAMFGDMDNEPHIDLLKVFDKGIVIESDESGNLDAAVAIIGWLLEKDGCQVDEVVFEWSSTCSSARMGADGGGAVWVHKNGAEFVGTFSLEPVMKLLPELRLWREERRKIAVREEEAEGSGQNFDRNQWSHSDDTGTLLLQELGDALGIRMPS